MNETSAAEVKADPANAIRDLCENTEPEDLWQTLEANGIETTPGVIYQVLNRPKDQHACLAHVGAGKGLDPDDLSLLGGLAAKAGGMEQLIHILQACQRISSEPPLQVRAAFVGTTAD